MRFDGFLLPTLPLLERELETYFLPGRLRGSKCHLPFLARLDDGNGNRQLAYLDDRVSESAVFDRFVHHLCKDDALDVGVLNNLSKGKLDARGLRRGLVFDR